MKKRIALISLLGLYVVWIGINVGHAASGHKPRAINCKNMGTAAHTCRHGAGKHAPVQRHDPNVPEPEAPYAQAKWRHLVGQGLYAASFGFFQDNTSVPVDCTCYVSCFLSGDGLPSPNWPN